MDLLLTTKQDIEQASTYDLASLLSSRSGIGRTAIMLNPQALAMAVNATEDRIKTNLAAVRKELLSRVE